MWSRLFIESCPACGGPSPAGFCATCAAELPRVANACGRCGLALPVARCPRRRSEWQIDAVLAPLAYAPPLDDYLHALKYRGVRSLGRAFGLLIAPTLRAASPGVDALVAVPLHPARLRERGYNQAREVARTVARELDLPLLERGIARRAATAAQTGRSARQRRAGVAHAFAVERELAGRRIAIVDDVVTTGATVNALAAALRGAGALRCVAVAVARTPERNGQPRKV